MSLTIKKKEALTKPPFFISYLITDPIEFGNTQEKLKQNLINTFESHSIDMVCFRDKISSNKEQLAKTCLEIARKYKIKKVLINSDIELYYKLGFDGIHLNSKQFDKITSLQQNNVYTIVSCHNEKEILLAKQHQSNAITYSPIFFKESKGEPKGIDDLKDIVNKYQSKMFDIFALGGIINNNNINEVIKTNAKGFASIRYFKI